MQPDYDLIICGAGPAGSSAAIRASRLGLKVLLLDKERFPRDRNCGDALSSTALSRVEELGLMDRLLATPHVRVSNITYYAPDGLSVTVPLLKIDKELPVTGMICRRVLFDELLLDEARQGAEVWERCEARSVLREGERAAGLVVDRGAESGVRVTARALIGADGWPSVVGRQMGVPPYPEYRAVAANAYFRQVLGVTGYLEVHFIENVLPGYVWIYPTESGMTNVGLTVPVNGVKKGFKPREALLEAVRGPLLAERFDFAERLGPVKTSVLPTGHTFRRVHGHGFVLVGDAAGLVNPCSQEGVSQALSSGMIAAEVLAEIIHEGRQVDAKALDQYPLRLWKSLGQGLKTAERLMELRTPKAIGSLVKSARRRPHNAGWISGILIGSALPSEELVSFLDYLDFFTK